MYSIDNIEVSKTVVIHERNSNSLEDDDDEEIALSDEPSVQEAQEKIPENCASESIIKEDFDNSETKSLPIIGTASNEIPVATLAISSDLKNEDNLLESILDEEEFLMKQDADGGGSSGGGNGVSLSTTLLRLAQHAARPSENLDVLKVLVSRLHSKLRAQG